MMKILNLVGLVRAGMDRLGVTIDAVIIIVNNAFALVNIMDAILLTELKPKTITSSIVFEPVRHRHGRMEPTTAAPPARGGPCRGRAEAVLRAC